MRSLYLLCLGGFLIGVSFPHLFGFLAQRSEEHFLDLVYDDEEGEGVEKDDVKDDRKATEG